MLEKSLLVLALVTVLVLYRLLVYPVLHGGLSHVPGPWLCKISSWPLAWYDLTYRRNQKILAWHSHYGPVVCIAPGEVSVATIEGTREIYRAAQGWTKSNYFNHFMGYNERSLFATLPYTEHREKRKLTAAFYGASNIYKRPEIEQYVYERCQAVAGQIAASGTVDVYALTDWYALDIITYLVFGASRATRSVDQPGPERRILKDLKHLQFAGPFRVRFPTTSACFLPLLRHMPGLGYLGADEELAAWCRQRVSDAIQNRLFLDSRSLVGQLLSSTGWSKEARGSGDDYVAAEVLDNINAAEATVSVTATYLIWLLSTHTQWQARIRRELRALPARSNGALAFADVDGRVPALEACLREAYRLYPASSGRAERVVPAGGCALAGVRLPAGTVASSSVPSLHRDAGLFAAPAAFRPERWLEAGDDEAGRRRREAQLIPFGYGGRICLGKALATLEIKMLVATLYLGFESRVTAAASAAAMRQCSTHDAVPWALECAISFRSCVDGEPPLEPPSTP